MRYESSLARHYDRSPDRISDREVKAYLFHLHSDKKRSTSTCNVASGALRFLYHNTLGYSRDRFDIPIVRSPKKFPHELSRDEVSCLIAGTHYFKHRVLFFTSYSTGLRVSEIVKLRPKDIDSGRMVMRIVLPRWISGMSDNRVLCQSIE